MCRSKLTPFSFFFQSTDSCSFMALKRSARVLIAMGKHLHQILGRGTHTHIHIDLITQKPGQSFSFTRSTKHKLFLFTVTVTILGIVCY